MGDERRKTRDRFVKMWEIEMQKNEIQRRRNVRYKQHQK
jgi:hypothetical protein